MNQTLLFRFLAPGQVEWLAEGGMPERGTSAELGGQAAGRRLVLAAPGEAVNLIRAQAPGRHRATWLRAIPYALEDSLVEDVEALHFAVGEASSGADVPVAVARREALDAWLAACAEAELAPSAVVPDPLLLPFDDYTWSLLVDDGRALVRTGRCDGFACELANLGLLLELALGEAGDRPPERLRVWGKELPSDLSLPVEVHREDTPPDSLAVLAADLRDGVALNLLQGPYSRKAHLGKWLGPWRAAAILAGVWLGLQLALLGSEYWQLSREHAALGQEMERIYRDAVPDARRIVNPRAQLEHRLQELRRGAGGVQGGFLALLHEAGRPLTAVEGVTLRGLRYKDGQLDLSLEGGSLEVLDRLRQGLAEQTDLTVEMRTTKREGQVESQLVLRKAPS